MQGKRIIELGAGCGLVGLVFAALGADVLLTDLPHVTVRHKRASLAQHALPSLIQLAVLTDPLETLEQKHCLSTAKDTSNQAACHTMAQCLRPQNHCAHAMFKPQAVSTQEAYATCFSWQHCVCTAQAQRGVQMHSKTVGYGMQSLVDRNISLNEATLSAGGGTAQSCELTWGVTTSDALPQAWHSPDLVVAADVVYHRELFQPLLSCLKAFGRKCL